MLLILEDDRTRTLGFQKAMALARSDVLIKIWPDAACMIADLDDWLPKANLISLDHDLEPTSRCREPGDGMMVAHALAARAPVCPVIVHTSNQSAGWLMMETLSQAGWKPTRVSPVGSDWIDEHWAIVAHRLLRR